MVSLITIVSKYVILVLCLIYTLSSFTLYIGRKSAHQKSAILDNQVWYLFAFHFVCYFVLFIQSWDLNVLFFFAAQIVFFEVIMIFYPRIYRHCSRKLVNNSCFLMGIGFIMLTRLSFSLALKQFAIVAVTFVITMIIPLMIESLHFLDKLGWFYAVSGFVILATVFVFGTNKNGATNWINVGGIAFQPSEVAKIVFVFFMAAMLAKATNFKRLVTISVIAAMYVCVLVVEKDLGAALIFFIVYLTMVYVATAKFKYLLAGIGGGAAASVIAYFLFNHVRVRVMAWQDPFAIIDGGGFQVCQSLFAIGTGSWFGLGLNQGRPTDVPIYESDFIFSGICEEFGVLFGLCVILICVSIFLSFMQISTKIKGLFYKLLTLGFGVCFIFQVLLNVGGVTKFIPSTGVTLPFVSYGGSSIICTLIMFSIVQGLYMISNRKEEVKADESVPEETAGGYEYGDDGYSGYSSGYTGEAEFDDQ